MVALCLSYATIINRFSGAPPYTGAKRYYKYSLGYRTTDADSYSRARKRRATMAEATPTGNPVNSAHAREDAQETHDWIDSLDEVFARSGPERVKQLLENLSLYAQKAGVHVPFTANTAYVNSIGLAEQPPYPGPDRSRYPYLTIAFKDNHLD